MYIYVYIRVHILVLNIYLLKYIEYRVYIVYSISMYTGEIYSIQQWAKVGLQFFVWKSI